MGTYFIPNTTVYLLSDTGIDESNKPFITSQDQLVSWLSGFVKHTAQHYSYQRADERQYIAVNIDYNLAIQCDILMWNNREHTPDKWYIADITGVEFKNPNTTWIYFEIDAYCTFGGDIDWSKSISLVEREHVENDWNGSSPNFKVMGVPEGIHPVLERRVTTYNYKFKNLWYLVRDPFALNPGIFSSLIGDYASPDFNGTIDNNVFSGLNTHAFKIASAINEHLNKIAKDNNTDITQIVDIQTLPDEVYNGTNTTLSLNTPWSQLTYNNAKCFSSEFCEIVIEGMLAPSVSFKPELIGSVDSLTFKMIGGYAGGTGGLVVYPTNYTIPRYAVGNDSPSISDYGKVYGYNIKNFPKGTWVGDYFAQWASMNALPEALHGLKGYGQMVTGFAIMGTAAEGNIAGLMIGANQVASGMQTIQGVITDVKSARLQGTVHSGQLDNSHPNLAAAVDSLGFSINTYMAFDETMAFIDSYFDRFGYKVMKLKVPNTNTRPYWNYVKCVEAHIDGPIPFFYRKKIEKMMNDGVTFWNTGAGKIGDFSSPEKNKG